MKEGNEKSKINLYFAYGVTENNYLENVEEAKFYKIFMVKSVGDLFISDYSKLRKIVITSYSIHYTKLYDFDLTFSTSNFTVIFKTI